MPIKPLAVVVSLTTAVACLIGAPSAQAAQSPCTSATAAVVRAQAQVVAAARTNTTKQDDRRALAGLAKAQARQTTACPAAAPSDSSTSSVSSDAPAGDASDELAAVNNLRSSLGLDPLTYCAALAKSSQKYADVMTAGWFAHVGPTGSKFSDRILAEGYRFTYAAENLAKGQRTVKEVMAAWVASPGHYANLIAPEARAIGFGMAVDTASGQRIWVQNFGAGGQC